MSLLFVCFVCLVCCGPCRKKAKITQDHVKRTRDKARRRVRERERDTREDKVWGVRIRYTVERVRERVAGKSKNDEKSHTKKNNLVMNKTHTQNPRCFSLLSFCHTHARE